WVPSISAFTRVFRRAMRGDDAWRCRRAVEFVDRSRGAVKKGSGDAGRYSRSFGLSASIASPPCGEWKAYRVTAAIARKLKLTETRSISVAQQQDSSPGRGARSVSNQGPRLSNRRSEQL